MSVLAALFDLQVLDTTLEQLRHKFGALPERGELANALASRDALAQAVAASRTRQSELEATMSNHETKTNDIKKMLERLQGQLKTIISPREAEALQHKMDALHAEMGSLDDESLVAMDESESLDALIAKNEADIAAANLSIAELRAALATAEENVKAEGRDTEEKRATTATKIDAEWLAGYETRRAQHSGIAVAKVKNHVCGGCHLDLSTSEIDTLKREDEKNRECPNCARWLVL